MCSTALVLAPTVLLSSSPEDNKLLRVVLAKSDRSASNCWKSLLEGGQYKCNPWVLDQMEKKLTLERFQREVSNNKCNPLVLDQMEKRLTVSINKKRETGISGKALASIPGSRLVSVTCSMTEYC